MKSGSLSWVWDHLREAGPPARGGRVHMSVEGVEVVAGIDVGRPSLCSWGEARWGIERGGGVAKDRPGRWASQEDGGRCLCSPCLLLSHVFVAASLGVHRYPVLSVATRCPCSLPLGAARYPVARAAG